MPNDELISDKITDAAEKTLRASFAAEQPTEQPVAKQAPKESVKATVSKAGEDPDEIMDLEDLDDVDLEDSAAQQDGWDALKKLGLDPRQITALLAEKAAGREPKLPDRSPQSPPAQSGLTTEQTVTLRVLMKRNPEAASAYMEALSSGQNVDPDLLDPDAPQEEILLRRVQKQEQQMANLQWQLVERDLGGRVHALLSKFEILNDPEKVTEVTKAVIAEICQDKTVDHTNVDASIQSILERKNKEEHRTIRRYIEGKRASQKLHPPSPKGASSGSPTKKPVTKSRETLSDWADIEDKVAAVLRSTFR